MGRESRFEPQPNHWYPTPERNVRPLLPHLRPRTLFIEPCAGDGRLVRHLEAAGHRCVGAFDIAPRVRWVQQADALTLPWLEPEEAAIITNPPYDPDRSLMHALIAHFCRIARECWLLLEAMWAFSGRAAPHLAHCTDIVPAGRMKIFEGSDHSGRKAFAWHRFVPIDGRRPRLWPVGVVPDA